MLEELKGKEVLIQTSSFATDNTKGKVLEVGDSWIKIQAKKKIEYISLKKVSIINTKI
ncbi:MAG: hypothetical protein HOA15_07445 [Candidatus Marinimicrobia bacterium]|jgi:hypothetical protein|nr:hypothetical protein [Candidatus Neomarinimicrobiota bacterium]MBT3675648.1 hypothetical protein [Candidatus Neomarinimicrobiota bacterium]MBT3763393.1 hypothetical protein [Candidatus Neomarinimicrobiota bacterium]MBT4068073.1 hypothetical protein [Candidatus Neomarinimicrobiota bacterium]MBT4271167.1 hypothetical protein [Candidatus Neomarinimicrobiota bacterium]